MSRAHGSLEGSRGRELRRALPRTRPGRVPLLAVARPRPGRCGGRHPDDVPERVPGVRHEPAAQAAAVADRDRSEHLPRPASAGAAAAAARDAARDPGRGRRGAAHPRRPDRLGAAGTADTAAGGAAARRARREVARADRGRARGRRARRREASHPRALESPPSARGGDDLQGRAGRGSRAVGRIGLRSEAARGHRAPAQLRALRGRREAALARRLPRVRLAAAPQPRRDGRRKAHGDRGRQLGCGQGRCGRDRRHARRGCRAARGDRAARLAAGCDYARGRARRDGPCTGPGR